MKSEESLEYLYIVSALRGIGLTWNQSKVYKAFVELGIAGRREIDRATDVDYRTASSVIHTLEESGEIRLVGTKPNHYQPSFYRLLEADIPEEFYGIECTMFTRLGSIESENTTKRKVYKGVRIEQAIRFLREDLNGKPICEDDIKDLRRHDWKVRDIDIPIRSVTKVKKRLLKMLKEWKLDDMEGPVS